MKTFRSQLRVTLFLMLTMLLLGGDSELWAQVAGKTAESSAQYEQMASEVVQRRCQDWVQKVAPEQLASWQEKMDQLNSSDPLLLVVRTLESVDPQTSQFLTAVGQAQQYQLHALLEENSLGIDDAWGEANVRLWLGRELSQRQLYEEALEQLRAIEVAALVDPATYYFHLAVCEHHLLQRNSALASLKSLLTECRTVPTRYRMLGELMQQDLAKLEEKSLSEISRKMRDVERRLDLGRSGQKVQKLEKEIIESLDDLIAKLEQQSGGGGGGGGGNPGGQPNGPAQNSRVQGGAAPGEVDNKELGKKDGWGSLPPKEKAEAKQILGTLFPPHYQRAIEAYNRKAAQRENTAP